MKPRFYDRSGIKKNPLREWKVRRIFTVRGGDPHRAGRDFSGSAPLGIVNLFTKPTATKGGIALRSSLHCVRISEHLNKRGSTP